MKELHKKILGSANYGGPSDVFLPLSSVTFSFLLQAFFLLTFMLSLQMTHKNIEPRKNFGLYLFQKLKMQSLELLSLFKVRNRYFLIFLLYPLIFYKVSNCRLPQFHKWLVIHMYLDFQCISKRILLVYRLISSLNFFSETLLSLSFVAHTLCI